MNIPFSKTTLGQEEKDAINKVIDSGWIVTGPVTKAFEEMFAAYVGAKYAVFVDSGTAALFLALKSFNLANGTRVAVPALTFTSTAEIIVHAGLEPVFVDVHEDDFSMIYVPKDVKMSIPVHLTGRKSYTPAVMYDSAHRIERGDVKDSPALWCYSFYATKNITTVQGGMIALNDEEKYQWLLKARDHGTSKGTIERYKQGAWDYSIDFIGWREKADDVRAAVGIEQLKKLDQINAQRRKVVERYNTRLGLRNMGNHIFPILVNERAKFIDLLRSRGIQASVHFLPLHKMPAYKQFSTISFYDTAENTTGYEMLQLPNTEYLGERLVSLPLFPQMTDAEVDYVCDAVLETNMLIHDKNP